MNIEDDKFRIPKGNLEVDAARLEKVQGFTFRNRVSGTYGWGIRPVDILGEHKIVLLDYILPEIAVSAFLHAQDVRVVPGNDLLNIFLPIAGFLFTVGQNVKGH
jgi:hypothetical protein